MIYYTQEHEWLSCDGDVATVGITKHAAEALGDIVFVEVKPVDTKIAAGDAAAVVESVKAASDIYAPVAGTIVEANPLIDGEPETINSDPEGQGWIYKIRLDNLGDLDALMDAAAYEAFAANG